jgi:hypothetical protein
VITVETRAAGRRGLLLPAFELPPTREDGPAGSPLTLRDLIERIVRREVEAFRLRQLDNGFLRALSPDEIEAGAERGAVRSGGVELSQDVDANAAVATALRAFEDGLYYVLIDRVQCEQLDEQVRLADDSDIVFLRLVPLAGG